MSYEMMPQSGYGAYELMPQSGYGQFGLGDDSSDCPKGTESWCYNPLVMHMREQYPGVLQSSNVAAIRDAFKKALVSNGRVPTSNIALLKTPTQAVVDAVAFFHRTGPVTQLPFTVLWPDAVLANMTAGQLVIAPPSKSKTVASGLVISPSVIKASFPKTMSASTSAQFPFTTNAPSTGPAMEIPAEAKKMPWLLIGAGALVVGGVAFFMFRK